MRIARTNLTPGMIVLLVIIAIPLILIALAVLIVSAMAGLIVWAVTGFSPVTFLHRKRERRRGGIYEGPFEHSRGGGRADADERKDGASASDDGTIECEVISARTVEPDDDAAR